jgi:NADPH-dependent glutamate synthase beta subunit-like oxidoreductase/dihydroorotate dehydrogenase/Pyruvate/2-oxoacid:ferredoxin oxidoreductase delta subunit
MTHCGTKFLTDAQLRAQIERCEYCEAKPCKEACPADCSPADFIQAARGGAPSDFRRAAALILGSNPLGGVCGAVCPEKHCVEACVRRGFDAPIEIPAVQATIIERAKKGAGLPAFAEAGSNGRRVAVLGAGPSGLAAAALLGQLGYEVEVHESQESGGGMCSLIPRYRLDPRVLESDVEFLLSLGRIRLHSGRRVDRPGDLLRSDACDAVVVATGLDEAIPLGIRGESLAVAGNRFLADPDAAAVRGRRVAIVGGGAIAADCAGTAVRAGASRVEMIALERLDEMPLPDREMSGIVADGVHITGRTRVTEILAGEGRIEGLRVMRVELPQGESFHPSRVRDVAGSEQTLAGFDIVVTAIGNRSSLAAEPGRGIFFTSDPSCGPTSVVEAVACGKNTALEVDAFVGGRDIPVFENRCKSRTVLPGRRLRPVPLDCDFFGRRILSPFLLSAGPPTDGYEPMRKAYEAGWAGGILKTAFDGLPIHIPSEYMFAFGRSTYANCDNVSGHSLDRVCREVERLRREFPDRLTLASTGGPVSGDEEADRRVWVSNTRKLEACGAMGIEYSLSCPQGGDGTKGDIVAQDAELTAKVVEWVMAEGEPGIPKLFKLTGAVTAIVPIVTAVREVFERHPGKAAGLTLANSFPSLAFRSGSKRSWEEGIVVGTSGEGVLPISYLTLAKVAGLGVPISGNGGPMDYRAAANFLALGARTVQFCTLVMKYGVGIVDEMHSGLSHLLEARGLASVGDLVGCALPGPITDFLDLPAAKKVSAVDRDLCEHCGNCTRCPYLAISLDEETIPVTDPARCVGCSICVHKCFAGALFMRERTAEEARALSEA